MQYMIASQISGDSAASRSQFTQNNTRLSKTPHHALPPRPTRPLVHLVQILHRSSSDRIRTSGRYSHVLRRTRRPTRSTGRDRYVRRVRGGQGGKRARSRPEVEDRPYTCSQEERRCRVGQGDRVLARRGLHPEGKS
jgi:hypothetical protein